MPENFSLISDFTFKSENRSATDWNLEDWYGVEAPLTTYPNRVMVPRSLDGLEVSLGGVEKNFDNLCFGPIQGFKVGILLKIFESSNILI